MFWWAYIVWIFLFNTWREISISLFLILWILLLLINMYVYVRKYFWIFICIFLWLCLGTLSSHYFISKIEKKENLIYSYVDTQEYNIVFEIWNVYKKSDFDIEYKSKILKIDNLEVDDNMYFLFKTKKNFDLAYGQIISLDTQVQAIKNFNPTFDYKSFMQSKWIYLIVTSYNFQNIGNNEPSALRKKVNSFREHMLWVIHRLYPENEAIFLGGILVWAREAIPKDLSDSFNNSWLTHLIAVSGYNITIIIVFLSYILSFFPKILRILIISWCIIFYVMVVWESSAVIRAAIMWMVAYYILMSWRKWNSLAILLFSWILMISINPFLLNYDIWFQLSFLAVFWLLYTQVFFKKIFFFLPQKFAIQESFVLTMSAFVFTLPIMIYNFGQISVLAPIANMLVWWSIPFAMLFGSLSIIAYNFFTPLWYYIWYIEYFLLKWTTSVATYFWSLDFALFKIDLWVYWIYFQVFYFMCIIFAILFFQNKKAA